MARSTSPRSPECASAAIAVPLIVRRMLGLAPADVAFLLSADLFACGVVTIIRSLGAPTWFGVELLIMVGVTFASVDPMVSIAIANYGTDGVPMLVPPQSAARLEAACNMTDVPPIPGELRLAPSVENPACTTVLNRTISGILLPTIILVRKFT